MATKLALYQAAIFENKEDRLSGLTEDRESRHTLDQVYDQVVAECLEEGLWNFAMRSVQATSDTAIETSFGHQYTFAKPDDWVRTAMQCVDPDFRIPLISVFDEGDNWTSADSTFYLKYVSNDENYGLDLGKWPASFTRYVELSLALRICKPVSGSGELKADIERDHKRAKRNALNKDAMNQSVQFPPQGRWASSRGGRMTHKDRWSVS